MKGYTILKFVISSENQRVRFSLIEIDDTDVGY